MIVPGIEYICSTCEDVEWRSMDEEPTFCFVCGLEGKKKYSSFEKSNVPYAPMGLLIARSFRATFDN